MLGHEERLTEEPLDLAGPGHGEFVFLGKFVHTEDRDDVLKIAIALKNRLHLAGHGVVPIADRPGFEYARGRGDGIDRGVDALLGDAALEYDEGVEVDECGRRRRVGQVVGGNVDRLNRGDRALGC